MDRFPLDLVGPILSFLPHEDTFAFRLVCRNFAIEGVRFSHREIRVSVTSLDLERLDRIVRSPSLARYVRRIIIDNYRLQDIPTLDEFIKSYEDEADYTLRLHRKGLTRFRPPLSRVELVALHTSLVDLAANTEEMFSYGLCGFSKRVLNGLPNLQGLVIASYGHAKGWR